ASITGEAVSAPTPTERADASSPSELEVVRVEPYNAESPARALAPAITPAVNAYVRTNFGVPVLSNQHAIQVDGAVEHPVTLSIDALRGMPRHSVTATMECAGNDRLGMRPLPVGEPWRYGALSTVTWTGVSLVDVLGLAGVQSDAVEVLLTAADAGPREDAEDVVRFARSLPLREALHRDTLLALDMNGAPLTPDHGAPVRLAVPGWYGMASVKWVTRIEVLRVPFTGYFQRQRYVYDEPGGITPVDRMRVKSIVTSPVEGARVGRTVVVTGWAWSGDGAIVAVDVCVDGGTAWQSATVGAPASAHAWTPWHTELELSRAGRIVLQSRASDASGATQPDAIVWNRLGYGNNAIRHVVVEVE
ncbi:MAG: sulfite oxidase, partial [Gemmatimonas sp.]